MMELSHSTVSLIEKIETFSGKKLTYKEELGILVELAQQHNQVPALEQLAFIAKFAHKSFGILQRIDKRGEGNNRLAEEFQRSVEKSKNSLKDLLTHAPEDVQRKFELDFIKLSPAAFQNLLTFFYDLSWYKNYQLDNRHS